MVGVGSIFAAVSVAVADGRLAALSRHGASRAPAQPHEQMARELLDMHNSYRCMHDAPPLQWDKELAKHAQLWAEQGSFALQPQKDRVFAGVQAGENIAWGFTTAAQLARAWYCEIECTYPYGTVLSWTDSLNPEEPIGHYTQMVWKNTTKLGCAVGSASIGGSVGNLWVCNYSPAGNHVGQFWKNVAKPVKNLSSCAAPSMDVMTSSCPDNPNCVYPGWDKLPRAQERGWAPEEEPHVPAATPNASTGQSEDAAGAPGEGKRALAASPAAATTAPPSAAVTAETAETAEEGTDVLFNFSLHVTNPSALVANRNSTDAIRHHFAHVCSVVEDKVKVVFSVHDHENLGNSPADATVDVTVLFDSVKEVFGVKARLAAEGVEGMYKGIQHELVSRKLNSTIVDVCDCGINRHRTMKDVMTRPLRPPQTAQKIESSLLGTESRTLRGPVDTHGEDLLGAPSRAVLDVCQCPRK